VIKTITIHPKLNCEFESNNLAAVKSILLLRKSWLLFLKMHLALYFKKMEEGLLMIGCFKLKVRPALKILASNAKNQEQMLRLLCKEHILFVFVLLFVCKHSIQNFF